MKTILFTLSLLVTACLTSNAAVRTVCNTPTTTIAQYSDIQSAVNASSSGDTIHVMGSPTNYAGFNISNKQLVVIGPGFSPDKNYTYIAHVTGSSSNINGTASSGTEIQGLVFSNHLSFNNSGGSPNNIRITRNYFNSVNLHINSGSTTYSNYTMEGNYFHESEVHAATSSAYLNFTFRNNIFFRSGNVSIHSLNNPTNTVLFDHNLWYGPSSGSVNCFNAVAYAVITNNIFVRRNAINNTSNLNFANNVTFNAGNNTPWIGNSNTDNGGNLANQDPQMVSQSGVNAGTTCSICDYTIATGPANNAGTDGKDIGLLFDTTGSLNWANSRNSRLPRIYSMNITNPTIPSGGTLLINVEGRKSN
jgi:hypothetical protein